MPASPPRLPERAHELLRTRFALERFQPGQAEALHALLTHGRALAVMPTGGGKSLIYQLGSLLFEGLTVVVSPLIALMKDQIDALQALGVAAERLDSTRGADAVRELERRMAEGSLRLLYVAPERFTNERFLARLGRTRIALFAVDEAHCISAWGHNFRPDYLKLAEAARAAGAERVLALTATATPRVAADIAQAFGIPPAARIVTSFHRPNLRLLASPTSAAERTRALVARLTERPAGSAIVYVTLQKTAEQVAARLQQAGLPAQAYHAGMDDEARVAVQEWWKASDRAVVVATIAFGMGIDKPDVRYVYHYNLPKGLESYSQEIGRAGRDGKESVCEVLGSAEDVVTLENFAYGDTPTATALESLVRELLGRGERFDVSLYELSQAHDLRPLVLKTALTYLELDGVLRQLTPFYATFRLKLRDDTAAITQGMPAAKAAFVRAVLQAGKPGRVWLTLDTVAASEALGEPRERVVALLDYLAERGHAEVQASEVRQRFERLPRDLHPDLLVAELTRRFADAEAREIERIALVPRFLTLARCQTNALLKYFGELRTEPCGHCGVCEGRVAAMPLAPERPPPEQLVSRAELEALAAQHPAALAEPRQQARFLCGLSSPATSRARLGRHPLSGALERHPFAEVRAWVAGETALDRIAG